MTEEETIEADGINYWILPHIDDDAESNFGRLIKIGNWQVGNNEWLSLIKQGDRVIFYVSDKEKNTRYFSGEATIVSPPHKPTHPSISGRDRDYEIDFNNVALWKVHLAEVKSRLKFILKEKRVGLAFKDKSIIQIDKEDYNTIKSEFVD